MNAKPIVALLAALAVTTAEWAGFFTLLSVSSATHLAAASTSNASAERMTEIVVTAHRQS